jgi:hypothetical protein
MRVRAILNKEWFGFIPINNNVYRYLSYVIAARFTVNSCVSFRCISGFTAFNISSIKHCMKQIPFCEINGVAQLDQKLLSFMTLECSLPCSQYHVTDPYSLLLESIQHLHTFLIFHFNIILSATSRRCKWSLFLCGFPNRTFYFCHCPHGY